MDELIPFAAIVGFFATVMYGITINALRTKWKRDSEKQSGDPLLLEEFLDFRENVEARLRNLEDIAISEQASPRLKDALRDESFDDIISDSEVGRMSNALKNKA